MDLNQQWYPCVPLATLARKMCKRDLFQHPRDRFTSTTLGVRWRTCLFHPGSTNIDQCQIWSVQLLFCPVPTKIGRCPLTLILFIFRHGVKPATENLGGAIAQVSSCRCPQKVPTSRCAKPFHRLPALPRDQGPAAPATDQGAMGWGFLADHEPSDEPSPWSWVIDG